MKIKVLTFGIARDIAGAEPLEVELIDGASIADLKIELQKRYPAFQRLSSFLFAVNAEYAAGPTILKENDEVAIIPPVSGG